MGNEKLHALGWPEQVRAVNFESLADGTLQPMAFYAPPADSGAAPLLVGLHTWSAGYEQADGANYARWCIDQGWVMVHPDFRGPNKRPQAAGSNLAVGDVLGAVAYARQHAHVDPRRIYLCGVSGGGHMALLLAGRVPELWAAVSAWVPIVDLAAWHAQSLARGNAYAADLVAVCGGAPGDGTVVDEEYRRRSPLAMLPWATIPLDINAGIRDGHEGSVPISHTLRAFNAVADPGDRIEDNAIDEFVMRAAVPAALAGRCEDGSYGGRRPLFRRRSRQARVTIFDGGHEIVYPAALGWLAQHAKTA